MLIASVALVGLFIATYLMLYKLGRIGTLSCSIGSCETVNASRYATLAGFPVAMWGVGFYVATLAVSLLGTAEKFETNRTISWTLVAMSGWGVLFSSWLTYLELAVIHAICQWCVVSAILVVVIFLLSLSDLRERATDELAGTDGVME